MKKNNLKISVNSGIYPMEAVKATGYTFTDKAFIEINTKSPNKTEVVLRAKDNKNFSQSRLKGEFLNELLHHSLRLKIAENNDQIRKFIVSRALMSSGLPGGVKMTGKSDANTDNCACQSKYRKPVPVKPDKKMANVIKNIADETDKDYKHDTDGIKIIWEDKNSDKPKTP